MQDKLGTKCGTASARSHGMMRAVFQLSRGGTCRGIVHLAAGLVGRLGLRNIL